MISFPLVGELLALDLINAGDRLGGAEGLAAWLAEEGGRLEPVVVGEAEVDAVRVVREAAAPLLEAARLGERPPPEALRALNGVLAAAPAHREVAWTAEGGLTAAPRRAAADPARRLAAELAEAVAELLTDPRVTEVRQCEGEGCVLLFLPAHPRRRWCVASVCGNRARVARYYARHKEG